MIKRCRVCAAEMEQVGEVWVCSAWPDHQEVEDEQ